VVDPADIFYIVNYLFTGGPAPAALAPHVSTTSEPAPFRGSITLGTPVLRGGRYVVPVIVDAAEGSAPQAISFKVRLDTRSGALAVRRAGAATELQPSFEISRAAAGEVSYLVAFDTREGGGLALHGPTVVAEVELPVRTNGTRLEMDPAVTLLSDASGTRKATVANGGLKLTGTDVAGREPRPITPRKEVQ
jgi:hypothetical protein